MFSYMKLQFIATLFRCILKLFPLFQLSNNRKKKRNKRNKNDKRDKKKEYQQMIIESIKKQEDVQRIGNQRTNYKFRTESLEDMQKKKKKKNEHTVLPDLVSVHSSSDQENIIGTKNQFNHSKRSNNVEFDTFNHPNVDDSILCCQDIPIRISTSSFQEKIKSKDNSKYNGKETIDTTDLTDYTDLDTHTDPSDSINTAVSTVSIMITTITKKTSEDISTQKMQKSNRNFSEGLFVFDTNDTNITNTINNTNSNITVMKSTITNTNTTITNNTTTNISTVTENNVNMKYNILENEILCDNLETYTNFSKSHSRHKRANFRSVGVFERRYIPIKELGKGSNGVVYQAIDKELKDFVVLKCYKMCKKRGFRIDAFREILTLESLYHNQRIVKLLNVLHYTDQSYLVLEHMDCSLDDWIYGTKYCRSFIIDFMRQIFEGLEAIHAHGIIHRDIKPSNILMKGNSVKISDFGSTRLCSPDILTTEHSLYETKVGTPGYRAPELIFQNKKYNNKVDIWGAGCVFAELIARNWHVDEKQELVNILHFLSPTKELHEFASQRNSMIENIQCSWRTFVASHCTAAFFSEQQRIQIADLLEKLLAYNPDLRPSARQALKHPLFNSSFTSHCSKHKHIRRFSL